MNWSRIAFDASDVLSVVLVIRLFSLRLHSAYRVFCAFLIFQVISESFVIVLKLTSLNRVIDYRVAWLAIISAGWVLSFWMVYALLRDILRNLPGILRFSQRVLNFVVPLSLVIALVSAKPEYLAAGAGTATTSLGYMVKAALIMDRLVATISLLSLMLMLVFIVWFPVTLPRNLAVFSVGFVVYFTAKTVLLLVRSFWAHESFELLNDGVTLILCICLVYWITFLNKRGESVPVTLGHVWQINRNVKLVNDLEHLNAVLARAGRR